MNASLNKNINAIGKVVIGSFLFCLGLNLFVTPMNLYASGVIGLSQIIRTLLQNVGIVFSFEISGYINLLFNIPLMILAYRSISRRFFLLTLLSIVLQSIFFGVIPIPEIPIIEDMLTACIVGGIITGYGIGLVLRSSGCAGGTDVLGVYFTKKFDHFSVGKLGIIINAVLFTLCMFLFEVEIAIYSILNTVIFSLIVDRVHYQNIAMSAMIFTRKPEIRHYIMKEFHRGVTYWKGMGGYTDEDTYILMTAVSKYEVNILRSEIKKHDPNAFIIFAEALNVTGNFEKHL